MDDAAEEIVRNYQNFDEDTRLDDAYGILQRHHTQEVISRHLRSSRLEVLDIGGATGPYAFWIADRGHHVHLIDLVPHHVERAHLRNRRDHPLRSCMVADARALPFVEGFADVVILHGPLYHLAARAERDRVLSEALRVLRPGGVVLAFAITRHAGMLYGLTSGQIFDDAYFSVVAHEVKTGVRENNPPRIRSLLKGYFHLPDELEAELRQSGFAFEGVIGVVGPGWSARDAEQCVRDQKKLERLLVIARLTERYPLLSQGMMAVGRKPTRASDASKSP